MRITPVAIATLSLLAAAPSLAQQAAVEGSWGCRANIDGTKAGILTIFNGSYGYASANFGSTASGTGTVQMYSDGVTFLDGNLLQNAGVEVGLLGIDDQGNDIFSLNTSEKPILTCRHL